MVLAWLIISIPHLPSWKSLLLTKQIISISLYTPYTQSGNSTSTRRSGYSFHGETPDSFDLSLLIEFTSLLFRTVLVVIIFSCITHSPIITVIIRSFKNILFWTFMWLYLIFASHYFWYKCNFEAVWYVVIIFPVTTWPVFGF